MTDSEPEEMPVEEVGNILLPANTKPFSVVVEFTVDCDDNSGFGGNILMKVLAPDAKAAMNIANRKVYVSLMPSVKDLEEEQGAEADVTILAVMVLPGHHEVLWPLPDTPGDGIYDPETDTTS